jgi:hypothetical protein
MVTLNRTSQITKGLNKSPLVEARVLLVYSFFKEHLPLFAGSKNLPLDNKITALMGMAEIAESIVNSQYERKCKKKDEDLEVIAEATFRLKSDLIKGIVK